MIVDGKSAVKTANTKPTLYENVKVWAAQGKHFAASNAKIKEFEYQQKSKFLALKKPLEFIRIF